MIYNWIVGVRPEEGKGNWTSRLREPCDGMSFCYHAIGSKRKMPGVWGRRPQVVRPAGTGLGVLAVLVAPAAAGKED